MAEDAMAKDPMAEPTVFIVDDDEAFRDSVKELVSSVGLAAETFRSALEFLDAFDPARPGCLVLDVRMARMSGIALQAKLKEMGARIPIVFISGHGDIEMAVAAVKNGAVDFVQKPYHEQQLLDAIDEALRRDAAQHAPAVAAGGLAERVATLTAREREVMALALKGLPSKLIAKELSISHRTVEQHRSRLLEKLGVGSMTELLRLTFDRTPE
jgi:two-component system response regulator DctR